MTRKIIQMFKSDEGGDCALADDGTTWRRRPAAWGLVAGWEPWTEMLPQDTAPPTPPPDPMEGRGEES